MSLFRPARDRALCRDVLWIDGGTEACVLRTEPALEVRLLLDTLFARVVVLSRSPYEVAGLTFGLFCGRDGPRFDVAISEPAHEGVRGMLQDVLTAHGTLQQTKRCSLAEAGLAPLLAFRRGQVAFLEGPETREFRGAAGRYGWPVLGASWSHAPDPDVELLSEPEEELEL